jgi:hypothetical protein
VREMESTSKAVGNAARRLDAMLTKARAAHAGTQAAVRLLSSLLFSGFDLRSRAAPCALRPLMRTLVEQRAKTALVHPTRLVAASQECVGWVRFVFPYTYRLLVSRPGVRRDIDDSILGRCALLMQAVNTLIDRASAVQKLVWMCGCDSQYNTIHVACS